MDSVYNGPKIEARTTTGGARVTLPDTARRLVEDPFFYGYRWVGDEQVPLTEEDLLDPQENDYVSEHTWHHWVVRKLCEILEELFVSRNQTDVLVGGNLKMLWRDSKVRKVAPDVVVIPGVEDPAQGRKSFDEQKEGTRPVFVLEVTSESTAPTDFKKKPGIYQRAQVEEYFVLDTLVMPWTLTGRQLHPSTGRYRKISPDSQGRTLATSLEVLFAIGADGQSLDLTNARSGDKLRDLHAEVEVRRAETEARRIAEEGERAAEKARRIAEERQRAAEKEIRRLKALLQEGKIAS
jgi:Uma2 family endonuclease